MEHLIKNQITIHKLTQQFITIKMSKDQDLFLIRFNRIGRQTINLMSQLLNLSLILMLEFVRKLIKNRKSQKYN